MLTILSQYIFNIEIKFIILIQYLFKGPEKNLNIIKCGKIITNKQYQNQLISYSVLFAFIKSIFADGISFTAVRIFIEIFLKIHFIMYGSKTINFHIKQTCKICRPYLEDTNIQNITIKKDKSKSFSFPSNSIQNSYVFYWLILNLISPYSYINFTIISIIIGLLSFIKTIRGLHYLHDIISALFIGKCILLGVSFIL
jgi:hypothetical protein